MYGYTDKQTSFIKSEARKVFREVFNSKGRSSICEDETHAQWILHIHGWVEIENGLWECPITQEEYLGNTIDISPEEVLAIRFLIDEWDNEMTYLGVQSGDEVMRRLSLEEQEKRFKDFAEKVIARNPNFPLNPASVCEIFENEPKKRPDDWHGEDKNNEKSLAYAPDDTPLVSKNAETLYILGSETVDNVYSQDTYSPTRAVPIKFAVELERRLNRAIEALQTLLDEQNDAPLERRRAQWEEACKKGWEIVNERVQFAAVN